MRRSIKSFVDAMGENARSFRFVITESGCENSTLELPPSAGNLLYINDSVRTELIAFLEKKLAHEGLAPGIAHFALSTRATTASCEGANRNAVLLATAGEAFLFTDDDVLFDIKRLPHPFPLSGQFRFVSISNDEDLASLESRASRIDVNDFLRQHEKLLQQAVFSSPGLRGDSGHSGARFIFGFSDEVLAELCEKSAFVDEALSSRLIWREAHAAHLTAYSPLMTYQLGINNTVPLPPFFPWGRNVDGSFVYATKALHPTVKTAHLPASVRHSPVEQRKTYSSLETLDFRLNDFLWLLWSDWLKSCSAALSQQERHKSAVAYFSTLTGGTKQEFEGILRDLCQRSLTERANHIEAQVEGLRGKSALKAWRELAKREIRLCRKIAQENALPLKNEADPTQETSDHLEFVQKELHLYAQLLEAWPLMRSFAEKRQIEEMHQPQENIE